MSAPHDPAAPAAPGARVCRAGRALPGGLDVVHAWASDARRRDQEGEHGAWVQLGERLSGMLLRVCATGEPEVVPPGEAPDGMLWEVQPGPCPGPG